MLPEAITSSKPQLKTSTSQTHHPCHQGTGILTQLKVTPLSHLSLLQSLKVPTVYGAKSVSMIFMGRRNARRVRKKKRKEQGWRAQEDWPGRCDPPPMSAAMLTNLCEDL
uniref:Uncharacterized protein n=1 Tax=Mus musculus TaxID=10090 RepID=Q3U4K9_MOUSE|nr:unnamed protein product [Mus musculus]